jgi:hypothetical protein
MIKKAAILIGLSLAVTALWFGGLHILYARLLTFLANSLLGAAGSEGGIALIQDDGEWLFRVRVVIGGRLGYFNQRLQTLLLPSVMMLSWQAFTPWFMTRRRALASAGINLGLFVLAQVIFLLLLTGFHTSDTARFFYNLLMDSFYILALLLIILDNIRNPGLLTAMFSRPATPGKTGQPGASAAAGRAPRRKPSKNKPAGKTFTK